MKNKIFKILRLIFYISFLLFFIIYPTSKIINSETICITKRLTGFDCPTCGVTRAFSCIMHFKFKDAFNFNPIFTLVICPISLFIIFEDIYKIIKSFIKKESNDLSLLTFIVRL